ncbi:MAG: ATP-binding cassette domain-containing protein [Planctomycetaceae bacterium]
MSDHVVEVRNLSRTFGTTTALDSVSLDVKPGMVYGLVGANGQGKTTLMRHLLGLLRAQEGTVRVFGLEPVRDAVQVLQRIGYLSEHREMPDWMRIDELMRYTAAFHPNWDQGYADELIKTFGLDGSKKLKDLSKGMRAQVGLIAAVSHKPDLLLLDEPSTGLDAVVRKDILNEIIRAVADDGRTAIFSSHLLDEVEQMSDYVLMIDGGKMVLHGTLDELQAQHTVLSVQFDQPREELVQVDGVLSVERLGQTWTLTCNGAKGSVQRWAEESGGEVTSSRSASLQEIFVAHVGRDRVLAEAAE